MKELMFLDPKKLTAIKVPDFLKDYLENNYHLVPSNNKKVFNFIYKLKNFKKFRLLCSLLRE